MSISETEQHAISAYGVRCPHCFAKVGQHCKRNGKPLRDNRTHSSRQAVARRYNLAHGFGDNVVINVESGVEAVRRGDEVVAVLGRKS